MTATLLVKSEQANATLNKRCADLMTLLAEKDERIASLQSMVRQRMPSTATSGSPGPLETPTQASLRDEMAVLRDRLLEERNRCIALEEEVKRLKSRPSSVFRPTGGHNVSLVGTSAAW